MTSSNALHVVRSAVIAGACGVLLPLAVAAPPAQAIDLKLADRLPQDHYVARYTTSYFIDEVRKATNGAVTIQRYPSERLGKSKDMLSLIKTGVTDMGEIFPGYLGEQMGEMYLAMMAADPEPTVLVELTPTRWYSADYSKLG